MGLNGSQIGALLLERGSICIGGAQEKEGDFDYKKMALEGFKMRHHMPYLLNHPKIPLLWIRIILGDQGGMACDPSF